MDKMTHRINC